MLLGVGVCVTGGWLSFGVGNKVKVLQWTRRKFFFQSSLMAATMAPWIYYSSRIIFDPAKAASSGLFPISPQKSGAV